MLPATSARVPAHTDRAVNAEIRRAAEARIAFYATRPEAIPQRLRELDEEWDIERTLEVNGSVLSIAGLVLGTIRGRRSLEFLDDDDKSCGVNVEDVGLPAVGRPLSVDLAVPEPPRVFVTP